MTLSRRSFLKVAGLTVVAAAGASMFTGCSLFSTNPIKLVAADDSSDAFKAAVEEANKKNLIVYPADASADYIKGYLPSYLSFVLKDFEIVSFEYKTEKGEDGKESKYLEVVVKEAKAA